MEKTIDLKIDTKPMIQLGKDIQIFLDKTGKANIRSKADFEVAGEIRNEIRSYLKKVEDVRSTIKKPVLDMGRLIESESKKITDPLEAILKVINDGMVAWQTAEDKRIKEINDRKMKEAEEVAEKERIALQEEANKKEKAGDSIGAQQLQEKAQEVTVAPVKLREATKVAGFTIRKVWKAKVTDFSKLPDEYKIADESKLNKFAQSTAGNAPVPGVEFYEEKSTTGAIR